MARFVDEDGGAGQLTRPMEIEPIVARNIPTTTDGTSGQSTARAVLESAPVRRTSIRRLVFAAVGLAVVGVAGYFGYDWWTNGRFIVSTDDAYVAADVATVTSKIAGYVTSVPATENSRVRAGDPLIMLDDSDYRIALSQAEAQIATGEAAVDRIAQQIAASETAITSAEARLAAAEAAAGNVSNEHDRVSALAAKQFATTSALDAARTAREQARQEVAAAEAAVVAARANVGVARAQKVEAERALDQYRLARDQAQLNLEHAVVRAPFDGVVGNSAAEPGEFVQPGQRLIAVVPLDSVYVDANFKETQLADLKPGQEVDVEVDAYPDLDVKGTVASVAPAAGSVFSLLPPDNATGNFTKIVQRIPVRIRLDAKVVAEGLIRPGMSVVAAVDIRTAGTKVAAR